MDIKDVELENTYQTMPPLTDAEYQELKEDIQEHGVHVPIVLDSDGKCIDGHHRLRICKELGISDFEVKTEENLTEQEKMEMSRTLNLARRHLTQEQKQKILQDQLSETPEKSDRQIGEQLGVDHKTVGAARKKMESSGEIPQLEKTVGADGRARASKPRAKSQLPPEPECNYDVEDFASELLCDVNQFDSNFGGRFDVHPEMLERADGRNAVFKALDEVQKILEKFRSITKERDETNVEDAGRGDDGEEKHELPVCCRTIRNGFQGVIRLVDVELNNLHESGEFDLYGGDILEALSEGIKALQEREARVRKWGTEP